MFQRDGLNITWPRWRVVPVRVACLFVNIDRRAEANKNGTRLLQNLEKMELEFPPSFALSKEIITHKKRNLTRNRNFSLFLFFLWMCWMSFGARPSCHCPCLKRRTQTYSDSMNGGAGSSPAIVYWNVDCFDYLNSSFFKKSCLSKNG